MVLKQWTQSYIILDSNSGTVNAVFAEAMEAYRTEYSQSDVYVTGKDT